VFRRARPHPAGQPGAREERCATRPARGGAGARGAHRPGPAASRRLSRGTRGPVRPGKKRARCRSGRGADAQTRSVAVSGHMMNMAIRVWRPPSGRPAGDALAGDGREPRGPSCRSPGEGHGHGVEARTRTLSSSARPPRWRGRPPGTTARFGLQNSMKPSLRVRAVSQPRRRTVPVHQAARSSAAGDHLSRAPG